MCNAEWCLLLSVSLAGPMAAQSPGGDSVVYALSPLSRLEVRTAKAGLLGFAGHEHLIRAKVFSGRVVVYPGAPTASHVSVTVQADSLEVVTPPDTSEIRKVTAAMRADVLDVTQYPEIMLASRAVERSGVGDTLRVRAALTMHGQTREVPLVVRVMIGPDTLRAITTFTVKQTDFGIRPYRGGPGGTVRVADRVMFVIEAVAVRPQ
jgi:polyisoprenoid-binding protein YceI